MRFTIIADTHFYGVSPVQVNISDIDLYSIYTVFVGDIYDKANCLKKDLPQVEKEISELQEMAGSRYISGNHELLPKSKPYIVPNLVAFIHGDEVLWSKEKSEEFRSKKPCDSGITRTVKKLWANKHGSISSDEAMLLVNYAKRLGVSAIVCGHVHPKQMYDSRINGIRVICVPRGKTQIDI